MDASLRLRPAAAGLVLALAVATAAAAPPAAGPVCSRVVAVGDLHGGYDAFVDLLQRTGLVDAELRWSGGGSCLVQLGDVVDRGSRSREVLDLLIDLERQGAGHVFALAGNHEVMNVLGDLRYVDPGEFAAFAGEETAGERDAGWEAFRAAARSGADDAALRAEFETAHPPGWFAQRRAFGPAGAYGRWIAGRRVLERIGDALFVHGGLSPADAKQGIDELNASLRRDLETFWVARAALIERGVIEPLSAFETSLRAVEQWLETGASSTADAETRRLAREFAALRQSPLMRPDGPLWYRELAQAPEQQFAPTLERILDQVGVARIVVGHTTTDDFRIASRFDGRVFVVDTGAGPAYGGRATALEIAEDGGVRALYPDGVVQLVEPDDDHAIEEFLTRAKVVESKLIGSGITRPKKLKLELNGRTRKAAFKTVSVENLGLTRFAGGSAESNFTDDYHYDRAAYLLDRMLGLRMIPVTVLRKVENEDGAAVDWVEDAFTEEDRHNEGRTAPDPQRWRQQQALMRLFDALIYNVDRNQGNQLYDPAWNLHLIDHTRSFRIKKTLPDVFLGMPASLPRELLPHLEALDLASLQQGLEGLLSKDRIKALLARRDAILAKIAHDRELHGDAAVFFPEAEP